MRRTGIVDDLGIMGGMKSGLAMEHLVLLLKNALIASNYVSCIPLVSLTSTPHNGLRVALNEVGAAKGGTLLLNTVAVHSGPTYWLELDLANQFRLPR